MLIYIRLIIPGRAQQTLAFNIEANDKIISIKEFVSRKIKNITVNRSLFAGKILDVNKTFQDYDIHKECTIQTMGKIIKKDEADNNNNNNNNNNKHELDQTSLNRQVTDETVRYGDVLIVNVMEARDLIKCDYWSGKSDPYCILSLNDKKLFRTRVISRSLEPRWNETFGFHLESPEMGKSQVLSVLMWDHDFLTPDDFMGTVDIDLADIPRYDAEYGESNKIPYEKWYKLDGVKSGEIRLLIRRAALTSPELRDILLRLERKKRPWTNSMLNKYNVTLKHFLGKEPWVMNDNEYLNAPNTRSIAPNLHINPALCRLEHLLLQGTLRISNDRTLARVANILWSQGALYTQDLPSRYLWLCDVAIPSIELYHLLQEVSKGSLKSLITTNNELLSTIPRRTSSFSSINNNNLSLSYNEDSKNSMDDDHNNNNNNKEYRISAIATFKSCEDAVLTLLRLQNRVLSLVTIDPEREDFVCVVPNQPRDISVGSANRVNITLYDNSQHNNNNNNPLHCGFASKPKQDKITGEYIHAFQESINVGIISIAGPYPTTNSFEEKSAENGQTHITSEWGYHLLVLHHNGILRAYTKLSDFNQKNCTFEMNIKSKETLILTCGPWSIELVDRTQKISYYLRAHNVIILSQWKKFLRLCKNSQIVLNNEKNILESCIRCKKCEINQPISNFYVLDQSNPLEKPPTCMKCIQFELSPFINTVKNRNDDKDLMTFRNLLEKFSIQDFKDLGTEEEFSILLDACTRNFLEQNNKKLRVINCPKCNAPFEMAYHSWATKQPNLTKELGLDRQPLSPEAQAHFLSNRFRCPNEKCQAIFCRLCNKQPYHLGFTCEEFIEYLNSPKCRFCSMAVMDRNRWKGAPCEALKIVCSNDECIEKAKRSCRTMLACGHPCGGVVDEREHLPCLHDDCVQLRFENEQKNNNNNKNNNMIITKAAAVDLCGICYTDELGNEPCFLLECGHIFHSNCLHERLKARWNGLRINFKYAHCPFCNEWMRGKNIDPIMAEPKRLYNHVLKKIEERLEIDEEEDDEYIDRVATDKASIYYGKPLEWALHAYAFYECSRCQLPYFGGRRNCEQNADDDQTNPEELICFDCSQNMGAKKCDIPGHSEFLLWKCRFCCSPAIWFCFGTTHFCDYCHSHWPPNRHPANAICPPKGQDKCPLGLKVGSHTNGDSQDAEYCLGCAMCRQEAKKAVSDKRVEEEKEFLKKRIARRKRLGLPTDELEEKLSDSKEKKQGIGRHSNTLKIIKENYVIERIKQFDYPESILSNIPIPILPKTNDIKYFEVVIYEPNDQITIGWALNSHPLNIVPGKDKLSYGINCTGTFLFNERQEKKDFIAKCDPKKRCVIGCGIDKDGNGFFTKDGKRSLKTHKIDQKKYWHAIVNFNGKPARIRFKFGDHFFYLPPKYKLPPNAKDNEPFPEKVIKEESKVSILPKKDLDTNTPSRIMDDRHVHPLFLKEESKFFCDGCQSLGSGKCFNCKLCKYDLHTYCAVVGPVNDNTWRCNKCTYINKKEQYLCEMCMGPKPLPKTSKLRKSILKNRKKYVLPKIKNAVQKDPDAWECPKCTKLNSSDHVLCEVCYEHQPRKNWNNADNNNEALQNRRQVLRDLLKDVRALRYGRAENDQILVPFGPPGNRIEIHDLNFNEMGIPQAPPLPNLNNNNNNNNNNNEPKLSLFDQIRQLRKD